MSLLHASVALGAPARVLVVDDELANRTFLRLVLRAAGFEVCEAADGPAALAIIAERCPDLVVLDYMMPGMDGPEVLRGIRRDLARLDVPVLLLTASDLDEHIEAAFTAGADDYITRPVDQRVLVARVRSAIQLQAQKRRIADTMARHERLRQDLEEARTVQQAQLPRMPATWSGGWRATGAVVPSGMVGGDIFALLPGGAEADATAALVDVCGHGTGAALVAATVRAEMRALLLELPLAMAFEQLNTQLLAMGTERYACVAAVATRGSRVTICNAGLPPIGLVRRGRLVADVRATGVPPGLLDGQRYEVVELELEPLDRIVMASDGLTEPFGRADDLRAALDALDLRGVELPTPPRLAERVCTLLATSPRAAASDDATVMILEYSP